MSLNKTVGSTSSTGAATSKQKDNTENLDTVVGPTPSTGAVSKSKNPQLDRKSSKDSKDTQGTKTDPVNLLLNLLGMIINYFCFHPFIFYYCNVLKSIRLKFLS